MFSASFTSGALGDKDIKSLTGLVYQDDFLLHNPR